MNKKEFWTKEQFWDIMKMPNGIRGCNNCKHDDDPDGADCTMDNDRECSGVPGASFQDGNFEYNKWEWDGETNLDSTGHVE